MKFISVKGYDNFEYMSFKCGGEVKHGIMQEDYKYLEVYVGVWGDSRTYNFYHVSAVAKLNF